MTSPDRDISSLSTITIRGQIVMDVSSSTSEALKAYGAYPFSSDYTYQQGLDSILEGGAINKDTTEEVKDEIIRRTRVFYFNKVTGNSITSEEARAYELSSKVSEGPTTDTSSNQDSEETRVLTFAELKELIESGRVDQIPNNKNIPDKLNDATPTESHAPTRKKPWELVAAQAETEGPQAQSLDVQH